MKVRVMAIRIFQILAVLGILLLALLVALMLPDCARLRAMIINSNSSPIEDITLKIRDEVIWSGGLKRFEARRFNLALYTNGIFEVEGRYVESDKRLKGRVCNCPLRVGAAPLPRSEARSDFSTGALRQGANGPPLAPGRDSG